MVFFTCNACGASLKKNQVEKHYQNECPSCQVLSCIDCGQDFYGDEYANHTKCISEAEKYQGALYKESGKGGAGKGERKQQEWLEQIKQSVSGTKVNPKVAGLLERISEYPNVPRKRKKFENFVRNSFNVRDQNTLGQLWDAFSGASKKCAAALKAPQEETERQCSDNQESEESLKISTGETKDTPKKKKKEQKRSGVSEANEETDLVGDSAEINGDESELPVKKKKKKKKKKDVEGETETVCSDDGKMVSQSEESEVSKKNKKKKKVRETSTDCVDPVDIVDGEVAAAKKVKKKRHREKENGAIDKDESEKTRDCVDDFDDMAIPKKKRKVKCVKDVECGLVDESSPPVVKKHKKKHKERLLTSEA